MNFNSLKHNPIKIEQYAQYFTNIKIATFIADMLNDINFRKKKTIHILDAGGIGHYNLQHMNYLYLSKSTITRILYVFYLCT